MRFQDKVAIVTGGSSGIGKEGATRFVAEGGSVVIIGRDAAKAEAAAKQIDATGKRAIAHVGDISLPATGQAAVKAALDRFGRLDVLFNNAGICGPKPFLEVTEDEYDRFLSTILRGKFCAAQAAAKAMKAAGRGGAIVQTGSMWGLQAIGATPSSAYSAANGGVHARVKNLAIELAPNKIRVNAIAPGVIETPVFSTFLTPEQVKTVLPTFNAMHPLGRNGQAADAAEALLFLASDEASFITGVCCPSMAASWPAGRDHRDPNHTTEDIASDAGGAGAATSPAPRLPQGKLPWSRTPPNNLFTPVQVGAITL